MKNLLALQTILVFPKNSDKYKEAFQQVKEELDAESIKYISQIFNINVKNYPLSEKQLNGLPNLYNDDPNSFEYVKLKIFLLELASRKTLAPEVTRHLCGLIGQANTVYDNVTLTAISLLLQSAYGIDGSQLPSENKRTVKEQIKNFLCAQAVGNLDLAEELRLPLEAMRKLLHHPTNQALRLQARAICEEFELPLDLPRMLSLSVDGVKCEHGSVDNLALVIGGTGAGKSTLINYLYGIEYEFKRNARSKKIYLQPKAGQPNEPARVGHVAQSQTLYPQVIESGALAYCDCPGFADSRDGEQAICSALGTPLAIHYAKHIRAIIVVITWETTESNGERRGAAFRLLSQTLARIIKEPLILVAKDKPENPVPLLFVISRPPRPNRDDCFNADELREAVVDRIEELAETRKRVFAENVSRRENFIQLSKERDYLDTCLTRVTDFVANQEGFNNPFSFVAKALIGIAGASDQAKLGTKEQIIEEAGDKLKAEGLHEKPISMLKDVLRQISRFKESVQREQFIKTQKDSWEVQKAKLQKEIDDLQRKIEEVEGEQAILELMKRGVDNIFIIRGYQEKNYAQDEPDHKELLLAYLKSLCEKQVEIPKDNFIFNPNAAEFIAVRRWAESLASTVLPHLRGLLELPEKITELECQIREQQQEIDKCKEELAYQMKVTQPAEQDAETKKLELMVQADQAKINALERVKNTLNDELKNLENELRQIEQAEPIEYASRLRAENRLWFGGLFFNTRTKWDYIFPGSYTSSYFNVQQYNSVIWDSIKAYFLKYFSVNTEKEIIPIHHVELSCLIDKNNKVLFKHQLSNGLVKEGDDLRMTAICDPAINLSGIYSTGNENEGIFKVDDYHNYGKGYVSTGHFDTDWSETKLEQGKLKVTYFSKDGNAGYAGVRVFVLPKHLPDYRKRIANINLEMQRLGKLIAEKQASIDEDNKVFKENAECLALLKAGLGYDQANKVMIIIRLLQQLGYTEEKFIDDFFDLKIKRHFKWLGEEKNYQLLEKLLCCNNEQFSKHSSLSFKAYKMLFGAKLDTATKKANISDEAVGQAFKEIPPGFLEDMYSMVETTGLNINSLYSLLNRLRIALSKQKQSLINILHKLEVRKVAYQYYCQKLHKLYNEYFLQLRTLDTIIELLHFSADSSTVQYSKCRKLLKEAKLGGEHLYLQPIDSAANSELQMFIQNDTPFSASYGLAVENLLPQIVASTTYSNSTAVQTAQQSVLPGYSNYVTPTAANNETVSSNNGNVQDVQKEKPRV